MDANQDYSSIKRKIVKPFKKWFIFGNASQGRTGANAPSPEPPTMTNPQTVSGVFVFGYTAKEGTKTKIHLRHHKIRHVFRNLLEIKYKLQRS